jgi:hypothetical protein
MEMSKSLSSNVDEKIARKADTYLLHIKQSVNIFFYFFLQERRGVAKTNKNLLCFSAERQHQVLAWGFWMKKNRCKISLHRLFKPRKDPTNLLGLSHWM